MSDSDLLLVGIVIFTETIIKTMNSFAGVFMFSYIWRNVETRESPQHSST